MIHFVLREPISYQRTLCQALSDSYQGAFVAWFADTGEPPPVADAAEDFSRRFISEVGYARLYRELRSDPRAVVILGSWSSAIAYKTLLIAQLVQVPVFIWTDHPHPRQRSCVVSTARKTYLRLLGRRAAGFLACGKPTALHLESLGIPPEKITNFPYWVSIPHSWSPPNARERVPLRLIAVGRHVSVKAFEVAIEAVALANKSAGRQVATLELVGDGPERQSLEALAKSATRDDDVTFLGWIENDQVLKRIAAADALVITSRFEPYGVVVLEALANGRPVLASDQVVAALDRDDRQGAFFFHPAGDFEALAQQIKSLAEDRSLLGRSAAAARAIAEEWPLSRAAEILQPLLDGASQHRRGRSAGQMPTGYDGIVNRPVRRTSDPS